ncbi:hypothetical protein [Paramicrobacterium fandaimingii]|uniref:hypothetical protein n=1 Tax=Paramicrobacterium fandaimingii TaxID=2708079 RepID=UPI00141F70D0|nr:hypothetical protein [Microbacterium fandaimingii]
MRIKKAELRQLQKESRRLLELQWAYGPLKKLRTCCSGEAAAEHAGKFIQDDHEAKGVERPLSSRYRLSGRFACRMNSCRPGDPLGCSMTNARRYKKRTEYAATKWLRGGEGRSLYLMQLEAIGALGQKPGEVVDRVIEATKTAVSRQPWVRARGQYELAGKILTFSIGKIGEQWVIRRRVLIAGGRALSCEELARFSRGIERRWARGLSEIDTRAYGLREVLEHEVPAVAQFMTGCISSVDPAEEPWLANLRMEFKADPAEQTPRELAEAFWAAAGSRKSDFRLYVDAMDWLPVWTAKPGRGDDQLTERWNACVQDARHVVGNGIPEELLTRRARTGPPAWARGRV